MSINKILLVTDVFSPSGTGYHALRVAKGLYDLGLTVDILTTENARLKQEILEIGSSRINIFEKLKLPSLNYGGEAIAIQLALNSMKLARQIKRHMVTRKYSVVHYSGMLYEALWSLKIGCPLFATVHGIFPVCRRMKLKFCPYKQPSPIACTVCDLCDGGKLFKAPFNAFYYLMYQHSIRKSISNLEKLICVSDFVKNAIGNLFKEPRLESRLITIYNMIDIEEDIKPNLEAGEKFDLHKFLRIPENSKIILYSGRMSSTKGVDYLIDAFKLIKQSNNSCYLVMVGQRKMNYIDEYDNIKWLGYIPRDMQLQSIKQSDVLVLPSIYPDACPTIILEALAIGTPVIASKAGGIPELLPKEAGILVMPKDAIALKNGIESIFNNDKFKRNCSDLGPLIAKSYDKKVIIPKILRTYEESY